MEANYARCIEAVLVHEGGKVDDPHDPGGRTAYGITQRVYTAYRKRMNQPAKDVWEISADDILAIYKKQYWDAIRGDKLPSGLDYCVFDGAVNSGVAQSIKWLQRALGPSYTGSVDGQMGQLTIEAVESHENIDALVANYCQRRMLFLKALKTWPRYGGGWSRRVNNVQRVAQAQAAGLPGPVPEFAGGGRKAEVRDAKKAPQTIGADASAGGGLTMASMSGGVEWAKDKIEPYAGAIPTLDTVVTVLAILGIILMGVGGLYAWYARKKAADLADALDTRPRQLAAPMEAYDAQPA